MVTRDSMLFYRSFYEAIENLPRDVQGEVYSAIFSYGLNGEDRSAQLKPIARSIWLLVKPIIDSNNKRYENSKKGGAPQGNQNATKTTEEQPKNNQETTKHQPNKDVGCGMLDVGSKKKEELPKDTLVKADRPPCPDYSLIVHSWNLFAADNGLAQVVQLSKSRKDKLRLRLANPNWSITKILDAISEQREFLCGTNKQGWKVSFDWLIENDKNFLKVLERQYAPTILHDTAKRDAERMAKKLYERQNK